MLELIEDSLYGGIKMNVNEMTEALVQNHLKIMDELRSELEDAEQLAKQAKDSVLLIKREMQQKQNAMNSYLRAVKKKPIGRPKGIKNKPKEQ